MRPHDRRSRVGLDWMLVLIGLVAAALMAGAVIRTDSSGDASQFGRFIGGVRSLGPSEELVIFEDGASGGAADWSAGRRDDSQVGLGAVWLIQPGDATVTRSIPLPDGTVQAIIRLDLIAIDDWALEGLEVAVDGDPRLRLRLSSRPDLAAAQIVETAPGDGVRLQARVAPARDLGFMSDGPATDETRVIVELAIDTPDPEVALSISPLPADETRDNGAFPAWAIDNLIVVAARLP